MAYFPTTEQFTACFPGCREPAAWYSALKELLPEYGIVDRLPVLYFLAQCAHESAEFNVMRENFNYSADGLMKIFPKYFNATTAGEYARKPDRIANRVYANRMGNGDEKSGDGWRYRGAGLIQLTGKSNIANCSKALFNDDRLVKAPELLITKEVAIRAACWFWKTKNLNTFALKNDIIGMTKVINGGTIGLEHRTKLASRILSICK